MLTPPSSPTSQIPSAKIDIVGQMDRSTPTSLLLMTDAISFWPLTSYSIKINKYPVYSGPRFIIAVCFEDFALQVLRMAADKRVRVA